MPTNNPMTEGEALAVIDRDRTVAAAEFRAHCYQLVDLVEGPRCLRWQEARGFRLKDTDEWVKFYVAVKAMQRLAGPDPYVALTAAQQPVQEGGGVCPKCRDTGEVCTGYIDGTPEMFDCTCPAAAPPSAPVGVELDAAALGRFAQDEWMDRNSDYPAWGRLTEAEQAAWLAVGERIKRVVSLTQQPAQAAPGDAVDADFFRWLNEHPANIQTMADLLRADQYVNLRRACEAIVPNDRRLSATPPGDDAAGGRP